MWNMRPRMGSVSVITEGGFVRSSEDIRPVVLAAMSCYVDGGTLGRDRRGGRRS